MKKREELTRLKKGEERRVSQRVKSESQVREGESCSDSQDFMTSRFPSTNFMYPSCASLRSSALSAEKLCVLFWYCLLDFQ